jgi:hypothetical protein
LYDDSFVAYACCITRTSEGLTKNGAGTKTKVNAFGSGTRATVPILSVSFI